MKTLTRTFVADKHVRVEFLTGDAVIALELSDREAREIAQYLLQAANAAEVWKPVDTGVTPIRRRK